MKALALTRAVVATLAIVAVTAEATPADAAPGDRALIARAVVVVVDGIARLGRWRTRRRARVGFQLCSHPLA